MEDFTEVLEAVELPPDAVHVTELTHRLTLLIMEACLDGTNDISAAHMSKSQNSPMGVARHLAKEVEKLLTIKKDV